ncbi:MAG: phage tail sheath C-terminal domain-containing protein [Sediminibacterium sp.]
MKHQELPVVIEATETSLPVFIGFTEKALRGQESLLHRPLLIHSMEEYTMFFGGAFQFSYMYSAIHLFFMHGGEACYIYAVCQNRLPSVDDYLGNSNSPGVFEQLDLRCNDATLMVLPDLTALGNEADIYAIQRAALAHCESCGCRFAILDIIPADPLVDAVTAIAAFRKQIGGKGLSYGAAYYPWLRTSLPLTDAHGRAGSHTIVLPPSAAIAGIFSASDRYRGVWKTPANISLQAELTPAIEISSDMQEQLLKNASGISINFIRSFPGIGVLVWGARTLDSNSMEWRYVHVRRTVMMIEQSVKKVVKHIVFMPNTADTWVVLGRRLNKFLEKLWKQGALAGSTPEEAYQVQIGLGSTMTPEDLLQGILRISILVAVSHPETFIQINLEQLQQSAP